MSNLDQQLYKVPIIGNVLERTHAYFKKNITLTDLFHVFIGFGIGLIVAGEGFVLFGAIALLFGAVYHLYAFSQGQP